MADNIAFAEFVHYVKGITTHFRNFMAIGAYNYPH